MNTEGTLWMGDIEPRMDESFIFNSFNQYGFRQKNIKLIKDKRLNKYKNFCFVKFNNLQEANNAIFILNGKKIPKTNMFFKLNLTKYNQEDFKNVYVGNLSPLVKDIELYYFFRSKYESVYYASIINDKGVSRGYGFVHFSNEEEYRRCLKEMDGILFYGKNLRVREKKNIEVKNNNTMELNNINILPFLHKYYANSLNQKGNFKEENSAMCNEETTFSSQEKEQNSSYSSSSDSSKKLFLENMSILESDDSLALNAKIKEGINKMIDYYKNNSKSNEISKIILYYHSNCK